MFLNYLLKLRSVPNLLCVMDVGRMSLGLGVGKKLSMRNQVSNYSYQLLFLINCWLGFSVANSYNNRFSFQISNYVFKVLKHFILFQDGVPWRQKRVLRKMNGRQCRIKKVKEYEKIIFLNRKLWNRLPSDLIYLTFKES